MNDFYLAIPLAERPSRPRCPSLSDVDVEAKLQRSHLAHDPMAGPSEVWPQRL